MIIHTVSYTSPLPKDLLNKLVGDLPDKSIDKFCSYKKWEDAHNYLFGRYLLMNALSYAGIRLDMGDLQYTSFGRPFFSGGPYFNISHSGTRVVCILSLHDQVGIDLEEIRELPVSDFKEIFSNLEWNNILHSPSVLQSFYSHWTAKESVIKADGRGLNLKLDEVDVTNKQVLLDDRLWQIRPIETFERYSCSIAYDSGDNYLGIKEYLPVDFAGI